MSRTTIVTCFPLSEAQIGQLKSAFGNEFEWLISDQEKIADDIFQADIFCGHAKGRPVDWPAVVEQGRLKWIQSTAAGLDHCLHPAVVESDIVVSGCSGLFASQVAEQTMALLFGLIRRLPTFFRAQNAKSYKRQPTDILANKTVGIVGFGGNGQKVASALSGLCQRIVATDCFPEECPNEHAEVWAADRLLELCAVSQVLIVTLPLTEETYRLVDAKCFDAMPEGGYFINVGRGSAVDQSAVVEALQSGKLAAAGLDVADPEPIPEESPLWEMGNVIITPHVGAQSPERVPRTIDLIIDNIGRYRNGEPLINCVDKQKGFPLPASRGNF